MIQAPSARGKARFVTFLVALVTGVAVAVACAPSQRANGEGCLKDSDCLSGTCVGGYCAPAPTLLDAEVNGDGGTADSTAADGTTGDTGSAPEAASPEGAVESGSGDHDTGAAETGSDSGSSDSSAE